MSSPGIDEWIKKAPESWAKLAKKGKGKQTFEQFKKKFFEGAEAENKAYLKDYLDDAQLRTIYEQGAGGTVTKSEVVSKPVKPKVIEVPRAGKTYKRATGGRWSENLGFSLKLAAKAEPKSQEYYDLRNKIMSSTGKSQQAVTKKIQRTRSELNEE
jgi:hypothetical protein